MCKVKVSILYRTVHTASTVQVSLQVGKVSWQLQTTMPTLRANPHTFMFAIPGGQTFYSVLIAASKLVLQS